MSYLLYGLLLAAVPIIVNGILAFLHQPQRVEKGSVMLPKFIGILGLVSAVFFSVLTVVSLIFKDSIFASVVFAFFVFLGSSLILAFLNCKISYDEKGFVARNLFGIKREFTYEQITDIHEDMFENHIILGKRKVKVYAFAIGGMSFTKYAKKRYCALHNGKHPPEIRRDIFNGNVRDATGFVVVGLAVWISMIAVILLLICTSQDGVLTADNTAEQQIVFISFAAEHGEITLTSSEGFPYKIDTGKNFDGEKLRSICDGNTPVTVYSKKITPTDAEPYYFVGAIFCKDRVLWSFAEINRRHAENMRLALLLIGFLTVLWTVIMIMTVIVGRNPKKFGKKIVRLFFKDGYIRDQSSHN